MAAQLAERSAELRPAGRPEGATWDRGWYDGITAAVAVARQGAPEPEPLRELAEWLVSLDGHPLMVERPTPADMRAIIRRAREALGKED